MDSKKPAVESIDAYIATAPKHTRGRMREIRKAIQDAAPDATEKISYQIPTFWLNGNLVHFAAYEGHIGLYPAPSGTSKFAKQLAVYRSGKGTVRFPLDQPLPLDLIAQIVRFRVKEIKAKEKPAKLKKPQEKKPAKPSPKA